MKVCSTCKEEKDRSLFGSDKRLKDGLRSQCKACHKKTSDAWREKNPEKYKASIRKAYLKNREHNLEKARVQWRNLSEEEKKRRAKNCKKYYEKKREVYLENRKKRRLSKTEEEKNRDRLKAKKYYEKNKETIKARAKKYYENFSEQQKKDLVIRTKEWRARNREKANAWSAVGNALFTGEIEKPPYCELCGVFHVKIHAHHEDYSKPLDVIWLCHDCHMSLHSEKRREKLEEDNNVST
jgi:hypothetical protein